MADAAAVRRARNIVWSAAGAYDFEPAFLAFFRDGTPDLYQNAVVGLTHRIYDAAKLGAFFDELGDSFLADTFSDVVWLGIEHAVYGRMCGVRPALPALREAHARHFLADDVDVSMQELMMRCDVVHTLAAGRAREVLTGKSGILNPWEKGLYEALRFDKDLTTDALIARSREVLKRYFVFRFRGAGHMPRLVLGAWGRALLSHILPKVQTASDGVPERVRVDEGRHEVLGGKRAESVRAFFRHSRPLDEAYREEIVQRFGAPFFPEAARAAYERAFCEAGHRYAHLFYTRGGSRTARVQNEAVYAARARVYQTGMRRLAERLRNTVAVTHAPVPVRAREGRFVPGLVWWATELSDPRVFFVRVAAAQPDVSVLLLLDGSASRRRQQGEVAAEARVLAESLTRCKIPLAIAAFSSVEGTTVMRVLKPFSGGSPTDAMGYEAVGWNRDGLALLATLPLFAKRQGRKLLLVLTDAHPADMLPLAGGLSHAYEGKTATDDARTAVLRLKKEGVKTLGLVTSVLGEADTAEAARAVFGTGFAIVHRPEELVEKAGRLIEAELRMM